MAGIIWYNTLGSLKERINILEKAFLTIKKRLFALLRLVSQ
jgi:hypothetical protein